MNYFNICFWGVGVGKEERGYDVFLYEILFKKFFFWGGGMGVVVGGVYFTKINF